ncbi:MAG: hypothetical protein QUU85_01875 [Candidatus Eisenbacteria bacterium]|nr:hypothetical protein [Candidatus Eisenbacteria bacterium]
MASKFSDIPSLRAEVALAQGVLAERSRDYDRAIELYRNVIEGVEPDTSGAGAPSVVLTLPVRVARLYVLQRNEAAARQAYDIAARYYERVSESHRGTVIEIDADEFLAESRPRRGNGIGRTPFCGIWSAGLPALLSRLAIRPMWPLHGPVSC